MGFDAVAPEVAMAVVILAVAAWIDWKEHRVPNWLTFPAMALGLLYHTAGSGLEGLSLSLLGILAGFATLVFLYLLQGMGAGDVKLMMGVGAWVGPWVTLQAFVWIVLFGALMGLYLMVASGQFRERIGTMGLAFRNLIALRPLDTGADQGATPAPAKILLPYGVPIAFGFWAYFVFGGLV